eukprot:jgi/Mesen1/4661/ME000241S03706
MMKVAFLAFGTRGDVQPLAVVAIALARTCPKFAVSFATHAAHEVSHTALMWCVSSSKVRER